MPLDARKAARVVAVRAAMRAGRTTQAAAVYRTAYGGQTARAVALVLKEQDRSDAATLDQEGLPVAEYLAELPLEVDPRPIAYLAFTGGATDDASIAAARHLEIVRYHQGGLVPNRWQVALRRLR